MKIERQAVGKEDEHRFRSGKLDLSVKTFTVKAESNNRLGKREPDAAGTAVSNGVRSPAQSIISISISGQLSNFICILLTL